MCIVMEVDTIIIGISAPPLAFEVFMLLVLCWNAVDRPRVAGTSLRTVLADDGALRFLVRASQACLTATLTLAQIISVLRTIQLAFSATGDAALTMLGVPLLSVACAVSTAFNLRFLARMQEASRANAASLRSARPLGLPMVERASDGDSETVHEDKPRVRWPKVDLC
jgi:hypothetical protein